MRTGKTEGVKNLVEEVLASLPEELMTEDVTDEVLFAIEESRLEDYGKLCEQLGGEGAVNPWIGKWVKELLGAESIRTVPSKRKNSISECYTKLRFDRGRVPEPKQDIGAREEA